MSAPKIVIGSTPLNWLDEGEEETRQWLMSQFPIEVIAFENTINVVSYAIDNREAYLPASEARVETWDGLLSEGSEQQICDTAAGAALIEALDSLHAVRRLLLTGYFSRMLGAVRTMVEALRTADVCRQNVDAARAWLGGAEVKGAEGVVYHDTVSQMLTGYDFLSKSGGHPLFYAAMASSLGKPYHPDWHKGVSSTDALKEPIKFILDYLNQSGARMLMYVNDICSPDWSANPELKEKNDYITAADGQSEDAKGRNYATRLRPAKLVSSIQADEEVTARLEQLFSEPPRAMTSLPADVMLAFSEFVDRVIVDLREKGEQGLKAGAEIAKKEGRQVEITDEQKEKLRMFSAFVIGFEIGHEYRDRWDSVFGGLTQ